MTALEPRAPAPLQITATHRSGASVTATVLGPVTIRVDESDGGLWLVLSPVRPLAPEDGPDTSGPRCRNCGADCSDGGNWDGGDRYLCGPCADHRAAANAALARERRQTQTESWTTPGLIRTSKPTTDDVGGQS